MKHKKQHYVPQSYLKSWCDSDSPEEYEPYVWFFHKRGGVGRKRAPSNLFRQTDLYTITKIDGSRDPFLEEGLSQLEGQFASIVRNKIEASEELSLDDRIIICAFASAMYARTKASEDRLHPFWQQLQNVLDEIIEWNESPAGQNPQNQATSIPLDTEHAHIVSYEEIREIVDLPIPSLLLTHIQVSTPLLLKLDLAVIVTSTKPGFITSDDPCVWFDPEGYKRPLYHRGPALIYPSIEITLPLSPSHCLLLNRRGSKGYIDLARYGPLIDIETVTEANWRTRNNSHEFIVVNRNVLLWDWFYTRSRRKIHG